MPQGVGFRKMEGRKADQYASSMAIVTDSSDLLPGYGIEPNLECDKSTETEKSNIQSLVHLIHKAGRGTL
jgi:hypothetical protein